MKIIPIGARKTNLMYVIIGENSELVFVDPVTAESAYKIAQENIKEPLSVTLLITHHHTDHSGGNSKMLEFYPKARIYAGSEKSVHTNICKDGEIINIGTLQITCMHTPSHTLDSFTYFVQSKRNPLEKAVFTGDTLFYLGCGRFFEGTGEMMEKSLKAIAALPGSTPVYYGHNYKERNIEFIKELTGRYPENIKTDGIFLTIEEERDNNLFMNPNLLSKCDKISFLKGSDRIKVLREMKNMFDSSR